MVVDHGIKGYRLSAGFLATCWSVHMRNILQRVCSAGSCEQTRRWGRKGHTAESPVTFIHLQEIVLFMLPWTESARVSLDINQMLHFLSHLVVVLVRTHFFSPLWVRYHNCSSALDFASSQMWGKMAREKWNKQENEVKIILFSL